MSLTELKVSPLSIPSPEDRYYKTESAIIDGKQTIVRFKTEDDYKRSLIIGEEIALLAKKLYPEKYANIGNNI